jgi:hypothetical protein
MKYTILCCALFGLIVPAQLMSMENGISSTVRKIKTPCLNFFVDKNYIILRCLAQKMQFAVPEKDFMGQSILEVIPLSPEDKSNVHQAFERAVKKEKTKKVSYTLENQQFVAKVTPGFDLNKDPQLFIKVTAKKEMQVLPR